MSQIDADHFSGFPMAQVESALCPQGDGGDERFRAIHQFIVGVPPKMVVAVTIEINEHSVECVIRLGFTAFANPIKCCRPGLRYSRLS